MQALLPVAQWFVGACWAVVGLGTVLTVSHLLKRKK